MLIFISQCMGMDIVPVGNWCLATEDNGRGTQAKREELRAHQAMAMAEALEQPAQPSTNAP